MKRVYDPDPIPMREAEYRKREAIAQRALWELVKKLLDAGIDIGDAALAELAAREEIKQRYPKS